MSYYQYFDDPKPTFPEFDYDENDIPIKPVNREPLLTDRLPTRTGTLDQFAMNLGDNPKSGEWWTFKEYVCWLLHSSKITKVYNLVKRLAPKYKDLILEEISRGFIYFINCEEGSASTYTGLKDGCIAFIQKYEMLFEEIDDLIFKLCHGGLHSLVLSLMKERPAFYISYVNKYAESNEEYNNRQLGLTTMHPDAVPWFDTAALRAFEHGWTDVIEEMVKYAHFRGWLNLWKDVSGFWHRNAETNEKKQEMTKLWCRIMKYQSKDCSNLKSACAFKSFHNLIVHSINKGHEDFAIWMLQNEIVSPWEFESMINQTVRQLNGKKVEKKSDRLVRWENEFHTRLEVRRVVDSWLFDLVEEDPTYLFRLLEPLDVAKQFEKWLEDKVAPVGARFPRPLVLDVVKYCLLDEAFVFKYQAYRCLEEMKQNDPNMAMLVRIHVLQDIFSLWNKKGSNNYYYRCALDRWSDDELTDTSGFFTELIRTYDKITDWGTHKKLFLDTATKGTTHPSHRYMSFMYTKWDSLE